MKNIKIYFTLFLFVFLGVSCFEDDSNYEYNTLKRHINVINVQGGTSLWGEPIVVTPTSFTSGGGIFKSQTIDSTFATRLRWEYFCPDLSSDPFTPICTTMVLNMDLWKNEKVTINTNYNILIRATDSLGNIYEKNSVIKYDYRYTSGWCILTDEGGNSVISLAVQSGDDWTINHDLRTLMGEPALGKTPRGLIGGHGSRYPDGIYVLQASNVIEALNANTYATTKTAIDMFHGGNVPAGLDPISIERVGHGSLGVIWNRDGKLYSKIFQQNQWATELFSERTVQYEGVDLSCKFLLTAKDNYGDYFVYDDKMNSFYFLGGQSLWASGKVLPIGAPSGNKDLDNPFPEPNNLSNFDVLHAAFVGGTYGSIRSILKEKTTNKVYFYQFDSNTDDFWYYGNQPNASKLTLIEITDKIDLLTEKTLYEFSYSAPYLFFVSEQSKKELYYLDKNTGIIRLLVVFPEEITRMKFQLGSDNVLGVVCEDNKLYILDVSEENFSLSLEEMSTGILDFSPYGKIVDFFKK